MSDGSRDSGRRGGFGRRAKKTVQRQRASNAPDVADEGNSLPAGLLLRFVEWFFDNRPPDPGNPPWAYKHFLTINIFLLAIPGAIGIFVFDDWLLAVGAVLATKGLFSVIFGVAETFLPIIMMLLSRGSGSSHLALRASGLHKEYYRKLHGIYARLMGLFYILVSLLFMPFIDGRSPARLLYLLTLPEGP